MSSTRTTRALAALFAVLVVASAGIAGVGTVGAQEEDDSGLDPADEIYVQENGDAVLVYHSEQDSEPQSSAQFGVDVGQGIMYALVTQPIERDTGTRGELSAQLTDSELTADGSLTAPRPQSLQDLSLEIDGESTDQNAQFDATLSASLASQETGAARLIQSASASGNVTTTATTLQAAADLDAQLVQPMGQPMSQQFRLTENDGSYTLDAAQNTVVREFQKQQWDTRERAKQTIQQQFASAAESLGGSATVNLESYSFTQLSQEQGTYRLDVEYTVQYNNVERGLARVVVSQLSTSENVNINRSQAQRITQQVQALTVNEAAVRFEQRQGSITGSFNLDLDNYDQVVFAGLDVAESVDSEEFSVGNVERIRAQFEAQQAANLEQRYTFSADVSQPSAQTTEVSVEATYRTKNWGAYVQELNSRGIQTFDTEYQLSATTDGEQVSATGSLSVTGEDMVTVATNQMLNATSDDAEAVRFLRAFRQSDLQQAKMDVSVTGEEVRFEAGTKFSNLAAVRDALAATGDAPKFTQIVGRTENGSVNTYVSVQGAVSSGASESDVRGLAYVDSETTIHMPGTWDREFPAMDRERAGEYLGVQVSTPTPTPTATPTPGGDGGDGGDGGQESPTADGNGPGFGVLAAVLALLAAALLATRRTE